MHPNDELALAFKRALTRSDVEQYLVMGLNEDGSIFKVQVVSEGTSDQCTIGFDEIITTAGVPRSRVVTAHSHVIPGNVSKADVVHCSALADLGIGQQHFIIRPDSNCYTLIEFYT